MTLEELNKLWSEDSTIDDTNLGREATKIPQLHNKYYNIFVKEMLRVKKLRSELKELEQDKYEYYTGTMAPEDLKKRGWSPNPLKIMKSEVNRFIESDKDIINISLKIDYHSEIAKYLEDIVKQINNRNFIIRSAIDWAKFQSGGI